MSAIDLYRPIYFEAIDTVVTSIRDRFDQPGFKVYNNLERLVINASTGIDFESELDDVTRVFDGDFDVQNLRAQLQIVRDKFSAEVSNGSHVTLSDVREFIIGLGDAKSLTSEVVKLVKLILVLPATNATSERSFSALRRVKTFLGGTMKQSRLNHLMLLHVHKDLSDDLDLTACANDFVSANEHRFNIFGKFC